jgi:hypothetical protein
LTIFFSGVSLITLNALSYGENFTQEYFIYNILPDLIHEKMQIYPKYQQGQFFIHMNNSMCHNSRKIADKILDAKLERLLHPPCSPDLSPRNFWLFGMLKHKMKDWAFQTVEEIVTIIKTI